MKSKQKKAGVIEVELDQTPAGLHLGWALGGSCLGAFAATGTWFGSRPATFLLRFLIFPARGFGRFVSAGNQLYQ